MIAVERVMLFLCFGVSSDDEEEEYEEEERYSERSFGTADIVWEANSVHGREVNDQGWTHLVLSHP